MNPPPYLWVYAFSTTVAITSLILFGITGALKSAGVAEYERRRMVRSVGTLLLIWISLDMLLGWLEVFRAGVGRRIPFIAFGIAIPVTLGIWLVRRSATARQILDAVPQRWLVGVQFYRVLGSIFLVLHGLGLLPGIFALPAGFGDVAVGLSALLVTALYAGRPAQRGWLVAWNVFGILDLIVALATGFLSSPGQFQMLSRAQPNYLVGAWPLVMVPIYAVPLSMILHVASLSKLARGGKENMETTSPDLVNKYA